jgi:DNA-binding NarL/FixJ family response regulator
LIVEDDRSWQQILAEILTDAGMAVDVVDSLKAAVIALRTARHRLAVVDLALGDGDYDNRDGLRVLDAIRRQDPSCVAILLTGFATVELAVSALNEYGAFTCLRKEAFRRVDFRALVDRALASAPLAEAETPGGILSDGLATDEAGTVDQEVTPGWALVVEDDAGWRDILSELLSDAGYHVRLCRSYGEALGRLRREKFALAVVDLSLEGSTIADAGRWGQGHLEEGLDGYQLLASTRAGRIPTIVVSGVATQDDIQGAYAEHDIFAYLQKQTFDRRTFLRTVEEARAAACVGSELDCLTGREREVLTLVAQGLTNKEIAQALVITTNTVKRHLKSIFSKLDVHTRSAAAAKAISAGMSAEGSAEGTTTSV